MKLPPTHVQPSDLPMPCIAIEALDYFQMPAVAESVGRDRWLDYRPRIELAIDNALDALTQAGATATFFVLAHAAREHRKLVRKIREAGHEIASHGAMADPLHKLKPASMLKDVGAAKKLLEDQAGKPVLGYRAPGLSLTRGAAWAVDVLAEAGYTYDSSVYAVDGGEHIGIPDAPAWPYHLQGASGGQTILEVPPLVHCKGLGKHSPAAGGRLLESPSASDTEKAMMEAFEEGRPAIITFASWEFDPEVPKLPLGMWERGRIYKHLDRTADRLKQIVERGGVWTPIASHLEVLKQKADQTGTFTLHEPKLAVR